LAGWAGWASLLPPKDLRRYSGYPCGANRGRGVRLLWGRSAGGSGYRIPGSPGGCPIRRAAAWNSTWSATATADTAIRSAGQHTVWTGRGPIQPGNLRADTMSTRSKVAMMFGFLVLGLSPSFMDWEQSPELRWQFLAYY